MDKIVFVTPAPISHRTAEENLGIGYLAAVLRNKRYNVIIIDGWLENLTTHEITNKIISIKNIIYIGFSCYRSNMSHAVEIIKLLNVKGVKVPFIAGGYGPTFYPEEFLKAGFDFVARGEAEETILELTEYFIKQNKNIESIEGICYIKGDKFIQTPARSLVKNIDLLPFPSRDTLHLAISRKSPVNILSSRGCQAHCIFCSIVAFQKLSKGKNWRGRTITNFVDELESLYHMGARYFKIIDDSFIEPPRDEAWCKLLSEEINQRMLNVRIRASIRADRVNFGIISHLKKAGFFSFSCGIENGSPTALKRMGKPASIEENRSALDILHEHGIYVQAGFILFDPFTTIEELEENYLFMKKYNYIISKGIFTEMYAAEGTPFNTLLNKKGLVTHEFSNHGNSIYEIQDKKVDIIYKCLKEWHKAHSKVYDQTIDPISAPKSLDAEGLKIFHSLFLELRQKDLTFMKYILDIVKNCSNIKLIEALELTNSEINKNKSWYDFFYFKVNNAYLKTDLVYDGDINPFIC